MAEDLVVSHTQELDQITEEEVLLTVLLCLLCSLAATLPLLFCAGSYMQWVFFPTSNLSLGTKVWILFVWGFFDNFLLVW